METETKKPIPRPTELLKQLLSPDDIYASKRIEHITSVAKMNTEMMKKEIKQRKIKDGLPEAIENEDLERLEEAFKEMHGTSMKETAKNLIISTLAFQDLRAENEVVIDQTAGDWIEDILETQGIEGVLDWATSIDVALSVVDEYQVVFDEKRANEMKNKRSKDITFTPTYFTFRNPFE